MRGLDQTLQLAGRDERDVLVAAVIDDHDVPVCLDLLEQAGEVRADVRVGGATRHSSGLRHVYSITGHIEGTACQVTSSSPVGSGADVTASPTWTAGPASPIRPAYSRAIRRRPSGPWPRSRAARPRGRRGPPFGWPTRSSAT